MSDNETNELLPCPFCGGEANVVDHHNDDGSVSVGCNNDTCLGFSGLGWLYKTEAEAIAAWNSRAELGSGTCDAIFDKDYYVGINGVCESLKCSSCENPLSAKFRHCPWCGARIRKAVER